MPVDRRGLAIRARYKGKEYRARVLKNGSIKFQGNTFKSPSGAGLAVNAREAAVVPNIEIYPIDSLTTLVGFLNGALELSTEEIDESDSQTALDTYDLDFADVRGQEMAKRALTIAAAGQHNVLIL